MSRANQHGYTERLLPTVYLEEQAIGRCHAAGIVDEEAIGQIIERAHDLAGTLPVLFLSAVDAILTAMTEPTEPLRSFGVLVPMRWWERPRILWRPVHRRRAARLAATATS